MSATTRTGYVTQTHTGDVSLPAAVDAGADVGLDFVELYMDGATERTALDPPAVADRVERAGLDLAVHLPFVDLDLGSARDRVREASIDELVACLDAAAAMGAEKAVVHPSSDASPPEWDEADVRPRVIDAVDRLDDAARDRGVELCAENLPGGLFTTGTFDRLLSATDVSMTFDTGHARVDGMDEADMADFLAERRRRVSHVHVNDSRLARDEHVPTGSGTIDFGEALAGLGEGWTGTLSIEVFTFDADYIALSARKLEASLRGTEGAP